MIIIRDPKDLPVIKRPMLTIGSFDGLHLGHQKILQKLKTLAKEHDGKSVVLSFFPHPRMVLYPDEKDVQLLSSQKEKEDMLESLGIDYLVVIPFDKAFAEQSAEEYVEEFLIKLFKPHTIVIGYDHRFGKDRLGSMKMLLDYAKKAAFEILQIEKEVMAEIGISSTKIRFALSKNDLDAANLLLGRPYTLSGIIIHGDKIGASLGFPTANLKLDDQFKLIPSDGIYAVETRIKGRKLQGMLYIGDRSTIGPDKDRAIEVHFFDFDDDIYDQQIRLDVVRYFREDRTYATLDALKDALAQDMKSVKGFFKSRIEQQASVGIVVLNYNGRSYLEKYIESWLQVAYEKAELIIADNASNDDSVEWLKTHHPDVRVIEMKENTGFAQGYNIALAELEHEYFALVNSDVELTRNFLNPIMDYLDRNPDVAIAQPKILDAAYRDRFEYAGACGGMMDYLGYPFCVGRILNTLEKDFGQYDRKRREIFWASGATMIVNANLFKELGGFDASYFAHQEEIDFCWRVKRAGFKIISIPESVIYHDGGGTLSYGSSRKVFLNFRNNLATIFKNSPALKLLWLIPVRAFLDLLAALHFLLSGEYKSALMVLKAHLNMVIWLPSLVKKRISIQAKIDRISLSGKSNMEGQIEKSILWEFYAKKNKTYQSLELEEQF